MQFSIAPEAAGNETYSVRIEFKKPQDWSRRRTDLKKARDAEVNKPKGENQGPNPQTIKNLDDQIAHINYVIGTPDGGEPKKFRIAVIGYSELNCVTDGKSERVMVPRAIIGMSLDTLKKHHRDWLVYIPRE
ncbi:MAG: hypothetical protein R3B90_09815 [Planctomycetaceae bacterium]